MKTDHPFQVLSEIIQERRSVRLFTSETVPPEAIEKAFDLALLAPNSSNLQPWEFLWVREPEKKKLLVQACLSQAAAATAAELVICIARTKTWDRNRKNMLLQMEEAQKAGKRIPKAAWIYYLKLAPWMYSQGLLGIWGLSKRVVVFFIGFFKAISREPSSLAEMKLWATKSTALACENFMLALQAQGFDTCPMEGMDSRRIKKVFRLPKDALVVMVIAIGKRRPEGITLPRIRAPRHWFIQQVSPPQ